MAYVLYNSRYPDYNLITSAYSDLPENEGVNIPRWGTVYRSAIFIAQYNPNNGEMYGCITNTDRASVYFQNASFLQWAERTGNNHYAYEMVTSGWAWSTQTTISQGVPDIPIFNDATDFINYIKTPAPPQYTWQSVPSISGKNGILNLSQIASASINNGEAVSGASASAFTSLTAQVSTMVTDDSAMSGADAGGISGSGSNSGNQSSGYAFGQGESGTNVSGGGSGYYGGEKGGSLLSGGAGSGYIGNSLVSNKKMVGYNVPTSSAEATKTESVNVYSATKEANKPKAGNGFARIKFLRNVSGGTLYELAKTRNTDNVQLYVNNNWGSSYLTAFTQYLGSNNILQCVRNGNSRIDSYDGNGLLTKDKSGVSEAIILIPITRITVNKLSARGYTSNGGQYRYGNVFLYKIENNALIQSEQMFQLPVVSSDCEKVLETPFEADYIGFMIGDGIIEVSGIVFNGD